MIKVIALLTILCLEFYIILNQGFDFLDSEK